MQPEHGRPAGYHVSTYTLAVLSQNMQDHGFRFDVTDTHAADGRLKKRRIICTDRKQSTSAVGYVQRDISDATGAPLWAVWMEPRFIPPFPPTLFPTPQNPAKHSKVSTATYQLKVALQHAVIG